MFAKGHHVDEVLLETVGPNGNIQAIVQSEQSGCCYFYLFGASETEFGMRSVWVRNYSPAPLSLDVEQMNAGVPPLNPALNCRHHEGMPAPDPDSLSVVWLPEGDGAALYENDELLAIIPPWSGMKGFDGYARDCIGQGPVAWELTEENVLIERFQKAEEYWQRWDDEDVWKTTQSSQISEIEEVLGPHCNYYAIDGGDWPPKALLRIPRHDSVVLITIGVSLRPQPRVELSTDAPEDFRRIELGVVVPSSWSDSAIKRMASYLSAQSNYPWIKYTWLGHGHTIPCDSWQNPDFTFALLTREHPNVANLDLGPQFDDPVHVLWFLPISESEQEVAENEGSDTLAQSLPATRWRDA